MSKKAVLNQKNSGTNAASNPQPTATTTPDPGTQPKPQAQPQPQPKPAGNPKPTATPDPGAKIDPVPDNISDLKEFAGIMAGFVDKVSKKLDDFDKRLGKLEGGNPTQAPKNETDVEKLIKNLGPAFTYYSYSCNCEKVTRSRWDAKQGGLGEYDQVWACYDADGKIDHILTPEEISLVFVQNRNLAPSNTSGGMDGVRTAFAFYDFYTGKLELLADEWAAKQGGRGEYQIVKVLYKDGKIDHILTPEEIDLL